MTRDTERVNEHENLDAERAIKKDNAAHGVRREHLENQGQSLRYTLNRVTVQIARMILALLLVNFIAQAFSISWEMGARSMAATALPILLVAYGVFTRSSSSNRPKISDRFPSPTFYVVSLVWLLLILIVTRYAYYYSNREIPFGEIALSITLSTYIAASDQLSFKALVASAYGIISGILIYVLVFGWAL
jgi:hypothetical protein